MLVDGDEHKVTSFELTQYDFPAAYLDTSVLPFVLTGMQHESAADENGHIFDWLGSYLCISCTEKDMILTPTSGSKKVKQSHYRHGQAQRVPG